VRVSSSCWRCSCARDLGTCSPSRRFSGRSPPACRLACWSRRSCSARPLAGHARGRRRNRGRARGGRHRSATAMTPMGIALLEWTVVATSGATAETSGGQIPCLSLLVRRGACPPPSRQRTSPSAASRPPAGRSPAIGRVPCVVLACGRGSAGRSAGWGRLRRRCRPPPLLARVVCLASAAWSAPAGLRASRSLRSGSASRPPLGCASSALVAPVAALSGTQPAPRGRRRIS
jgi:hypothetical protein